MGLLDQNGVGAPPEVRGASAAHSFVVVLRYAMHFFATLCLSLPVWTFPRLSALVGLARNSALVRHSWDNHRQSPHPTLLLWGESRNAGKGSRGYLKAPTGSELLQWYCPI